MTIEIRAFFAILGTAMLLFITGWIRADIVAVLVLVSLAPNGLSAGNELLQASGLPVLGFFEIAPVGIALIVSFTVCTLVAAGSHPGHFFKMQILRNKSKISSGQGSIEFYL
jgi:hypothetical protein